MTVQEAFARNLNECMLQRGVSGWTNRELSRRCGISDTQIGGLRRGERNPSLYTAYVIAKAFGCTVDDMLEGCDE